jgi:SAM-dependent methyltransferase
MYITTIFKNESFEDFDWESYFSLRSLDEIIEHIDFGQMIRRLRGHLKENKFRLAFTLNRVMKKLLEGMELRKPRILELGAATGFLTRWLINEYGGSGVLVDKSEASYRKYKATQDEFKRHITYLNVDLFTLELEEKFNLICSFGLIEHFMDKEAVLDVHKKFLSPDGVIVILVPLDSPLTRAFLEVHPELNLGYRELLTEREFKGILKSEGLAVIRTETSRGYSYDFVGAACHRREV